MTLQTHLETQLKQVFSPVYLEVINESHQHGGSRTDSHFKLVVVSHQFTDMTLIARHRAVNQLFKKELNGQVHALAIHTYTPAEWQQKNSAPASPLCRGGSKQ